jgi:ACS family glucarate transporter-like MFS transporter
VATTVDSTASEDGKRTNVRWKIIALLFFVTTINYADRATFSIAAPSASQDLGLSPVAVGYILSAFAWAYVLGQVPGGALLDRFGSKRVYTLAISIWSIFTLLQGFTGFLVGLTAATALFTLRFCVGLAESPSFPGNARIVASWFPGSERGTASAIFNSAQYFSLVAFAPLMGWLAHSFDWPWVFIVMGGFGIVAAAIFARYVHSPSKHPQINQAELDYIEGGGGLVRLDDNSTTADRAQSTFTWHNVKQLLTSRMMVGVYLGQYCINVLTYFFATWFPIYLVKERGLNIMEAGFAAAAPALCGFVGGVLGGYLSDLLLKKTGSLTIARKTPLLVGMILASSIILCVYIEQEWLVVATMAVAFFGKGIASLGWAVVSDTAPKNVAGLTGGIFNTFGNIAGIVTPIVIGYIVAGTDSFDGALIFVGAHCLLTIIAYFVIVGKIERLEIAPEPER